jgi:hypothetical protein
MKSIAGAVVVLAGAVIMGLAAKQIPDYALPTLTSLGLMLLGLIIVFSDKGTRAANKEDHLDPKG